MDVKGFLASSLSPVLEQIRRDLFMVREGLAGRSPPPLVSRTGRTRGPSTRSSMNGLATRSMCVERVVRETADAVTLVLADPSGTPVSFIPGQFFTVLLTLEGQPLRRAYSASCAPGQLGPSHLSLTVKRVRGGRVSNHLNDHVRPGDVLELLGPSGSFVLEDSEGTPRHLVLVAGGSGITPMMAIIRGALGSQPATRVSLVYGNRGEADIIFRESLAALVRSHPEHLTVRHVLGLLSRDRVGTELESLGLEDGLAVTYYVCGPAPMMREVREALLARGVPAARIREERFSQPHLRPLASSETPGGPQPVEVRLRGVPYRVMAAPGATVLETGLGAGLPLPYSCAMGGCGACRVTLLSGEVRMEEPNCLTLEERAKGQMLACVARPVSPIAVEVS